MNWILRLAALIVPADKRAAWLAEWDAELAFVRPRCGNVAALFFCAGAFSDAIWMRRNGELSASAELREIFQVRSPLRCLAWLTVLALSSLGLALRFSSLANAFPPEPYRDSQNLAMVTLHPDGPRYADVPLWKFRAAESRIPDVEEAAFYTHVLGQSPRKPMVVAIASPNLFRMLSVAAPAQGLILARSTWRRLFKSDPTIIGRKVEVDGRYATVTGIISDNAWQLPAFPQAWLLDEARFQALPPNSSGYVVARLRTPAPSNFFWTASTTNSRAEYDRLTFVPIPHESVALVILALFLPGLLALPVLTRYHLGAYPANRHAPPRTVRVRRWFFLATKIALILPTLLCSTCVLGVVPLMPGCLMMSWLLSMRWAWNDQRNRCPVCLHSLSLPVRIGEASHTFLEWYGTELVCTRGHGLLHVPEISTSCYSEQRWLYLDPSWSS
jgi:hypothetical protein